MGRLCFAGARDDGAYMKMRFIIWQAIAYSKQQ